MKLNSCRGDTMSAGIGGADRSACIAYLVPGLPLMTIGSTRIGTAVSVPNDMTEASSPASAPWRSIAGRCSSDMSSGACCNA